jgi:hypothetical protein
MVGLVTAGLWVPVVAVAVFRFVTSPEGFFAIVGGTAAFASLRHRPGRPRRAGVALVVLAGYVWVGVLVHHRLGAGYAAAMAGYERQGECSFGSSGGCHPVDLRPSWLFVWAGVAIAVALAVRARRRR